MMNVLRAGVKVPEVGHQAADLSDLGSNPSKSWAFFYFALSFPL